MRVRNNYTLEVDVEQYCEATEQDLTKVEVRDQIQKLAIELVITHLTEAGVKVDMLGLNNVYDPIQKLTVAEHLVTGYAG